MNVTPCNGATFIGKVLEPRQWSIDRENHGKAKQTHSQTEPSCLVAPSLPASVVVFKTSLLANHIHVCLSLIFRGLQIIWRVNFVPKWAPHGFLLFLTPSGPYPDTVLGKLIASLPLVSFSYSLIPFLLGKGIAQIHT